MTGNTATIIDNIFSNNILDNISCEHFSQFLSVKREKIDLKEVNIYINVTILLSQVRASMMSQYKIGIILMAMPMIHLSISITTKLEGSVNRHASLKKLSPKEAKVKSKPWLGAYILKLIKVRNKVFARKKTARLMKTVKQLYNLHGVKV